MDKATREYLKREVSERQKEKYHRARRLERAQAAVATKGLLWGPNDGLRRAPHR